MQCPVFMGSCMMGENCTLFSLFVEPWRWLTLAVDYRRLTCAALLLGGIGKPVPQRLATLSMDGDPFLQRRELMRIKRDAVFQ